MDSQKHGNKEKLLFKKSGSLIAYKLETTLPVVPYNFKYETYASNSILSTRPDEYNDLHRTYFILKNNNPLGPA